MSKRTPIYERNFSTRSCLTNTTIGAFRVRVWSKGEGLGPDPAVLRAVEGLPLDPDPNVVIAALRRAPGVAALEITDIAGNGIVVYTEWQ